MEDAEFTQLREMVQRMSHDVWRHDQLLQPAQQAPLLNRRDADNMYSPHVMRGHLAAGGAAPLPLAGLLGAAATTQRANIPEVSALPEAGDNSVEVGTAVFHQGTTYRKSKAGWVPIGAGGVAISSASAVGGGSGSSGGGSTGSGSILSLDLTLSAALTVSSVAPAWVSGGLLVMKLLQDSTGGWPVTWGANFKYGPPVSLGANLESLALFFGATSGLWELCAAPILGRHT